MRILLVANGYPPEARGGVENYTRSLALSLVDRGHAVEVFCRVSALHRPEYSLQRDVLEGIPVRRIVNDLTDTVRFEDHYLNPHFEVLFRQHIQAFQPEVIHFQHCLGLSASLLLVAQSLNIPVVITLHDFWFICPRATLFKAEREICAGPGADVDCEQCLGGVHLGPASWLKKWRVYKWFLARLPMRLNQGFRPRADRLSSRLPVAPGQRTQRTVARHQTQMQARTASLVDWLKRADCRLTPSAFVRDIYVKYGLSAASIQVLPLGIEQEALKNVAGQAGKRSTAGPTIGYIGSLQFHKGADLLVQAYRSLPDLSGRLTLYGRGEAADAYENEVRQQARGDARIAFKGSFDRKDLPGVLSSIDLLVIPSRCYETYSLVAREALLAGVPVLAARAGALTDVIFESVNGYLFPPGDVEALSRVLLSAAANLESLRAGVRAKAASGAPTTATHIAELEMIYRQVVYAHPASE